LTEKLTVAQNADMNMGDKMKFCPKCGSTNIEWVLPQDWSKWECRNCGYIGPLIIEDGKMAEEIRKEYLKKQKEI
jgi:DNA-directed RNA polymerase subunit M